MYCENLSHEVCEHEEKIKTMAVSFLQGKAVKISFQVDRDIGMNVLLVNRMPSRLVCSAPFLKHSFWLVFCWLSHQIFC